MIFKKQIVMAVCISMCLVGGTLGVIARTQNTEPSLSLTYTFETPVFHMMPVGDTIYETISINSTAISGKPGEPGLPAAGAYILLPPNTKVNEITVYQKNQVSLGTNHLILPIGISVPTSALTMPPFPEPDVSIYRSTNLFPGTLYDVVGTYSLRGYTILVLTLYPVQYVPATGELFFSSTLEVSVKISSDQSNAAFFRNLPIDRQIVVEQVDNPHYVTIYDSMSPLQSVTSTYDLLIITTDELKPAFQELADYHDEHGVKTVITTLSEISSNPTSTAIRDYIINAYTSWNIQYVLIGGDDQLVPARTLWVYGLDEELYPYETYMPSDLYYACLDGSYNSDGDNKWGEPTDGENGNDVDLMAEVYVGRACADTVQEARIFVEKTISYLNTRTDEYLDQVCLAGEYLGDFGVASWGGNYLDQIIDNSNLDGYTTVGIPSNEFTIETLYDRDWQDNYWPKTELMNRINNGIHLLIHDGHSNYKYALKMSTDDVEALTNDQLCFIYSTGCNAGGFDVDDCIAEYFTVKTSSGAFAAIMNARYGWLWSFNTDSDSQRYNREFWDAVFGEHISTIGQANQDSREDNIYLINRSCMRWTYYGLNLFGDPSVALHLSNAPNIPARPSGESNGKPGAEYTYTTSTQDIDGDDIYYQWDWADGTTSEWMGPFKSEETVTAHHTWAQKGRYAVKVRAKDAGGAESDWSEPLPVTMPKLFGLQTILNLFLERVHGLSLLLEIIASSFIP